MLNEEEINKIVEASIKKNEKLGERTGKSGHKAFVGYEINDIDVEESDDLYMIEFFYTIFIETEFTYYPDNPPIMHSYKKRLTVDSDGKIVEEYPKEIIDDEHYDF